MKKFDLNTNTKEGEKTKWVAIGLVAIVTLSVAYFGIVKPILNAVGLTQSKVDKEAERLFTKALNSGFWSPTYYEGKTNKISFSNKATEGDYLAREIASGWGYFNDDESSIINVFSKLKNNVDLSYVAYHYQKNENSDLLNDINEKLSSAEKIIVFKVTNNLK